MRENNDLGIFDFDDFAMEMTSTELLLVNGGACGGGFSGFSGGYSGGNCGGGGSYSGGYSGSYSGGSSSVSSSCGGASGSSSGSSSSSVSSSCGGSSVSNSCGGSFNGGSGTSVSYGNCGGGTIPTSNNCGGGYTGSGPSYTSSGCGGAGSPYCDSSASTTNNTMFEGKVQDNIDLVDAWYNYVNICLENTTILHHDTLTYFHYEGRDEKNVITESFEEILDSAENNGIWKLLKPKMSKYHQNGFGAPELKFICEDGREAVFTKDFSEDGSYQLYTDPRYKGTYNYCNPEGVFGYLGHFFADMVPYYLTGNSNERNQ